MDEQRGDHEDDDSLYIHEGDDRSFCYEHKTNTQHTLWPELTVLISFGYFYKHALHGWSTCTF